jgi:predicted Fe-Mo cluster-binding NifX family protein
MIIAMPMSRGRLAAHFTKAQRIGFFNEYHHLVTSFDNPAIEGGCSAKQALLTLIIEQKTDIVIVQQIGERMLGKLLDGGISVSKGDNGDSIEALLTATSDLNRRLLQASQGRRSLNHEKKGACCASSGSCAGGCGCGGKQDGTSAHLLDKPHLLDKEEQSGAPSTKAIHYSGFRPLS